MAIYAPMVRRVAQNYRRYNQIPIDLEELVSWGQFGLLAALNVWDPDRGVRFESLAAIHIRGRIIDELRTQDWAPRNVRRRQREHDRAVDDLARALGRRPTETEIAELLDVTEDDVRKRNLDTEFAKQRSLQEAMDPMAGAYHEPEDSFISTSDELEAHVLLMTATDYAMAALSTHEQLVIVLVYWEGLPLEEVSRVTGYPAHKVSSLHSEGVLKVRSRLAELLVA